MHPVPPVRALALATCLVLPLFAAVASAQDYDPSPARNVVFDAGSILHRDGLPYLVAADGSTPNITYGESVDVFLTNLATATPDPLQNDTYVLTYPGSSVGVSATMAIDHAHTGPGGEPRYNLSFASTAMGSTMPVTGRFDAAGAWFVNRTAGTETGLLGAVHVAPAESLLVTVTPGTVNASDEWTMVQIEVREWGTDPVAGARVTIPGLLVGGAVTDVTGRAFVTIPVVSAGTFLVHAEKNVAGDAVPELVGEGVLAVAPVVEGPEDEIIDEIRESEWRLAHLIGEVHAALTSGLDALGARVDASRDAVLAGLDATESRLNVALAAVTQSVLDRLGLLEEHVDARFDAVDADLAAIREDLARVGASRDVGVALEPVPAGADVAAPPAWFALVTVNGAPASENVTLAVRVDGAPVNATIDALGDGTFRVTLPAAEGLAAFTERDAHAVVVEARVDAAGETFVGSALTSYRG